MKLGCSGPKRLGGVANHSSGIADPISDIIAPILKFKPTWLQIQRQLGNGMQLSDTTAGRRIAQDLSGKIRKYQESFDSTLAEIQQSHEHKIRAALQEQANKLKQEIAEAKHDREMLKADFEKRVKADNERRRKLAEEQRSPGDWQSGLKNAAVAMGMASLAGFAAYKYLNGTTMK